MMPLIDERNETEQIREIFPRLQRSALTLRTEAISVRKERLHSLRNWIHKNREEIHRAMYADFQKPALEVDAIELFHVLNEINHAVANMDDWAKRKKVDAPLTMLGTRSYIQYEPRGVCLIISPWNYPFSLAVGPLVSALAAGNAVVMKPSELTPNVSSLLKKMASEVFNENVVTVIEGDATTAQHLLKLPFDHIFFTGSPAVGKEVMKAAAENLTSVTLELGGKSPTIVTASANLEDAAQRIAVAKFVNNGQTCIAPDYVLADRKIAEELTRRICDQTKKMFSENNDFFKSSSYCRIVNDRHFMRVNKLLEDALIKGAKLTLGGNSDVASRFIHPTVLTNVPVNARMLDEEIFGPVLPIIEYGDLNEAIGMINARPKPLALYIYSSRNSEKNKVLAETTAGGVCVNDSGIHFLNHELPFGGVNNSGMGRSHGHYGFLAFSNEKPVLHQKSGITSVKIFYPPYTRFSKRIMDWFLKFF